jgi:signal transduction histidine kinase
MNVRAFSPEVRTRSQAGTWRRGLSLRTRGLLALAVLGAYSALAVWMLTAERQALAGIGREIEGYRSIEAAVVPAFNTLAHALVRTQDVINSPDYTAGTNPRYAQIAASLDPLVTRLLPMRGLDPSIAADIDLLQQAVEAERDVPSGRNLQHVRDAEQHAIAKLNDFIASLDRRLTELDAAYDAKERLITVGAVVTSIVGALGTAAVILFFFSRLAQDIRRLQERAVAIVSGYSGEPLQNRRHDEIGGLIEAVNHMQDDLRRWEQQQELGRQQRYHQDKMAAIGSMAAAIGHEVSNPIAAIAGVSQFLIAETSGDPHPTSRLAHDLGTQILQQTERISHILRQLGNLTRSHSLEPELIDLNALLRSTCSFIAYDRRFSRIDFEYEFDHELPAVTTVADHVTQVLMNLLINAADALQTGAENGQARIRIETRSLSAEVRLSVEDNGHGMTPEVMARAFDESFTTKPVGRGSGIGLYLCRTLVEQQGGRIELSSSVGVGTTANVFLPLQPLSAASA